MKVFLELIELKPGPKSTFFLNPLSIEAFQPINSGGTKIITPNHKYFVDHTPGEIIKLVEDFLQKNVIINGM